MGEVHAGSTNNNMADKMLEANSSPAPDHQALGAKQPLHISPPTLEDAADEEEVLNRNRSDRRIDSLCVFAYCLGLLGFLGTFHLKHIAELLPYPVVGNIQDANPKFEAVGLWHDGINLIPVIWAVRYIRKICMLIFNLKCRGLPHSYSNPEDVKGNCCGGGHSWWPCYILPVIAYHGGLAIWVGLATNYHLPYHVSDLEWIIAGLIIWLIGELLVTVRTCVTYRAEVKARRDGGGSPAIRVSLIDKVVEAGEVVSCVGFAAFTLTLPACVIVLVRFIVAVLASMGFVQGKVF